MLLLPLLLGGFTPAAGPDPSARVPDLAYLARVSTGSPRAPRRDAGMVDTEPAEFPVESAANASVVFVLPPGPRTVRALEVVPTPKTAAAWRRARLRLTWEDDDPDPSRAGVDLPLGLAFGRVWDSDGVRSLVVASGGGAWVNRLPMPYRTRALLRVDTDSPLEGRIRVRTTRGADPDAGFLKAALWTAADGLAVKGRGHLVGALVVSEGRLRPEQAGRLVVDGKPVGPLATAMGWAETPSDAPGRFYGVLTPGAAAGRPLPGSAAFAWRADDPVGFLRSFSVEAGAGRGVDDAGPAAASPDVRQTAAVFWYTEAPGPRRGTR